MSCSYMKRKPAGSQLYAGVQATDWEAEASFGAEKAAASRRTPKEDAGLKPGATHERNQAASASEEVRRDSSLRKVIRSEKCVLRSEGHAVDANNLLPPESRR